MSRQALIQKVFDTATKDQNSGLSLDRHHKWGLSFIYFIDAATVAAFTVGNTFPTLEKQLEYGPTIRVILLTGGMGFIVLGGASYAFLKRYLSDGNAALSKTLLPDQKRKWLGVVDSLGGGFKITATTAQAFSDSLALLPTIVRPFVVLIPGLLSSVAYYVGAKEIKKLDHNKIHRNLLLMGSAVFVTKIVYNVAMTKIVTTFSNGMGLTNFTEAESNQLAYEIVLPGTLLISNMKVLVDFWMLRRLSSQKEPKAFFHSWPMDMLRVVDAATPSYQLWFGGFYIGYIIYGTLSQLITKEPDFNLSNAFVELMGLVLSLQVTQWVEIIVKQDMLKYKSKKAVSANSFTSQVARDLAKSTIIVASFGALSPIAIASVAAVPATLKIAQLYHPQSSALKTVAFFQKTILHSLARSGLMVAALPMSLGLRVSTLFGVGVLDAMLYAIESGAKQNRRALVDPEDSKNKQYETVEMIVHGGRVMIGVAGAAMMAVNIIQVLVVQPSGFDIPWYATGGAVLAVMAIPAVISVAKKQGIPDLNNAEDVDLGDGKQEQCRQYTPIQKFMRVGQTFIFAASALALVYNALSSADSESRSDLNTAQNVVVASTMMLSAGKLAYDSVSEYVPDLYESAAKGVDALFSRVNSLLWPRSEEEQRLLN